MTKAYHICILSVCTSILGILLAACNFFVPSLSYRSRSLLIIFSCVFIFIGIVSFMIYYKHYLSIKGLLKGHIAVIASWTYTPYSSNTLLSQIQHQKHISLFISIICLLFVEFFILIFARSETQVIPLIGSFFAVLVLFFWIIICRFILNYYEQLAKNDSIVLFSKDCIYFMDTVFFLTQGLHILENIDIYHATEDLLIFEYGLDEMDHSYSETLTIPIPPDKLQIATYLKNYYRSILTSNEDE